MMMVVICFPVSNTGVWEDGILPRGEWIANPHHDLNWGQRVPPRDEGGESNYFSTILAAISRILLSECWVRYQIQLLCDWEIQSELRTEHTTRSKSKNSVDPSVPFCPLGFMMQVTRDKLNQWRNENKYPYGETQKNLYQWQEMLNYIGDDVYITVSTEKSIMAKEATASYWARNIAVNIIS